MKNKRSPLWTKKRSALESKEARVKSELDDLSNDFEQKVKRVAIISLASGVAVWAGYQAFKMAFGAKTPQVPVSKAKVTTPNTSPPVVANTSPLFSVKRMIVERAITTLVKFAASKVTSLLAEKVAESSEEEED